MILQLPIPLINLDGHDLDSALELKGTRFDVRQVNWPADFPYAPLCSGRIARTKDALVVDFRVSGLDLRAQNTEDNDRQWEDSCVEVFLKDPSKADYYNFEANALGKVLACTGPDRHNRVPRPSAEMEQILRIAQRENGPLDESGVHSWRVALVIPFRLIGVDPEKLPKSIRANFYKCGDLTAHPHFLSWAPVFTEQPDFHRPEFFGELLLR